MHIEESVLIRILLFIKPMIIYLPLLFVLNGCGNDDVGPDSTLTATSQICDQVIGSQAIFWDLSNGIPRVDLPNGQPPVIDNYGGMFSHPDFPLLGFNYPQGWSPVTLRGPQTVGVNLLRQDGQRLWRWFSTSVNGFVSARNVRDFETNEFIQNLDLSNNINTICVNEGTITTAIGISQSFSNILITVDGFTALIEARTTNKYRKLAYYTNKCTGCYWALRPI